jgi:hypothetical protein
MIVGDGKKACCFSEARNVTFDAVDGSSTQHVSAMDMGALA